MAESLPQHPAAAPSVEERRRYKRMHARVPLRIATTDAPDVEITTVTVDISTGGGSFELPIEVVELHQGDIISVEILVDVTKGEYFSASASVRYARKLPPSEDAPPLMRYGVQFREALLLNACDLA